jgi:hypothetical protein
MARTVSTRPRSRDRVVRPNSFGSRRLLPGPSLHARQARRARLAPASLGCPPRLRVAQDQGAYPLRMTAHHLEQDVPPSTTRSTRPAPYQRHRAPYQVVGVASHGVISGRSLRRARTAQVGAIRRHPRNRELVDPHRLIEGKPCTNSTGGPSPRTWTARVAPPTGTRTDVVTRRTYPRLARVASLPCRRSGRILRREILTHEKETNAGTY